MTDLSEFEFLVVAIMAFLGALAAIVGTLFAFEQLGAWIDTRTKRNTSEFVITRFSVIFGIFCWIFIFSMVFLAQID